MITDVRVIYDDDGDRRSRDVYVGAAPNPGSVSRDLRAQLDYGSRRVPVRLDLRPGHPSEDRVSAIPKIYGSHAPTS